MTDRFWIEGRRQVRKAAARRRRRLDRLGESLRAAVDPEERHRIEEEIRELLAQYSPSDEEIERSLFLLR